METRRLRLVEGGAGSDGTAGGLPLALWYPPGTLNPGVKVVVEWTVSGGRKLVGYLFRNQDVPPDRVVFGEPDTGRFIDQDDLVRIGGPFRIRPAPRFTVHLNLYEAVFRAARAEGWPVEDEEIRRLVEVSAPCRSRFPIDEDEDDPLYRADPLGGYQGSPRVTVVRVPKEEPADGSRIFGALHPRHPDVIHRGWDVFMVRVKALDAPGDLFQARGNREGFAAFLAWTTEMRMASCLPLWFVHPPTFLPALPLVQRDGAPVARRIMPLRLHRRPEDAVFVEVILRLAEEVGVEVVPGSRPVLDRRREVEVQEVTSRLLPVLRQAIAAWRRGQDPSRDEDDIPF